MENPALAGILVIQMRVQANKIKYIVQYQRYLLIQPVDIDNITSTMIYPQMNFTGSSRTSS